MPASASFPKNPTDVRADVSILAPILPLSQPPLVRACPKTAPARLRRILCRNLCRTDRSICSHFDKVSDEVSDKSAPDARSWDKLYIALRQSSFKASA